MPPVTDASVSLPERYRLVGHIADGGMASVWAAEDGLLGRLVAVKLLSPILARDDRAQRRFLREARAGAQLSDCRHIVTIYDFGEHAGRAYLVMQHFAGGTVADRLRAPEPITRPVALRWLRAAAEALDHAHRNDVVHRDVKPANLLLDERGNLAVGDFGIAKVATETPVTAAGQVLGTAAYLSPEQAVGRPATAASDIYALAVVAFELLTGRRPFMADTLAAQARAHVEGEIPRASAGTDLPPAVDAVLERGLAKDPAARPRSAVDFVERLDAALGPARMAVTAPTAPTAVVRRRPAPPRPAPAASFDPPPAEPPPPRRARRRPWPAIAALAALLAAAGAALAVALPGGGSGEDATSSARRPATGARTTASTASTPRRRTRSSATPAPTTAKAQTQTQAPTQATKPATPAAPAPAAPAPAAPSATTTRTTPPAAPVADPAALNARGKALIDGGDATAAVPVLQRSVSAYRDSGRASGLPYAFALYNLGNALRLSGRPGEAVPVLEERMRVSDNQRPVVERELALARRQAGTS
jgi:eukaryotic-like serine/threonine-protein kinase